MDISEKAAYLSPEGVVIFDTGADAADGAGGFVKLAGKLASKLVLVASGFRFTFSARAISVNQCYVTNKLPAGAKAFCTPPAGGWGFAPKAPKSAKLAPGLA